MYVQHVCAQVQPTVSSKAAAPRAPTAVPCKASSAVKRVSIAGALGGLWLKGAQEEVGYRHNPEAQGSRSSSARQSVGRELDSAPTALATRREAQLAVRMVRRITGLVCGAQGKVVLSGHQLPFEQCLRGADLGVGTLRPTQA